MFRKRSKNKKPMDIRTFINRAGISREEAAEMLRTDPALLERFEHTYAAHKAAAGISDNLFQVSAKEMKSLMEHTGETDRDIQNRIVSELLSQTEVLSFDGKSFTVEKFAQTEGSLPAPVTADEVRQLPEEKRPCLTGFLAKRDMGDNASYPALLSMYKLYLKEQDERKKKNFYGCFRQGLDILDLDPVTYEMLGMNPNAIGNWFPAIATAAVEEGFFRIPKTKIAKVPITLLQLSRLDYMSLNKATLDIVDEWARIAFSLQEGGDYFIKTGTYSSKFDFRNAHVHGEEVRDLGQYLLYIQAQANAYAHYDLSGRDQPVIYGISTTNEWAVREFIPSESDAHIYHGMPLRPEYRIFVDMDACRVIGRGAYWDPATMKRRFEQMGDKNEPDMLHDSLIYRMEEPRLMKAYQNNIGTICSHMENLLPKARECGLTGQWSVDVMQEGDAFYLIDMAVAESSAFYGCVPHCLRRPRPEQWLPDLSGLS